MIMTLSEMIKQNPPNEREAFQLIEMIFNDFVARNPQLIWDDDYWNSFAKAKDIVDGGKL